MEAATKDCKKTGKDFKMGGGGGFQTLVGMVFLGLHNINTHARKTEKT